MRPTICLTFTSRNGQPVETVEGRISEADFEALLALAKGRVQFGAGGGGVETLSQEAARGIMERVYQATRDSKL